MIPKIIHFCWLSRDPYPELVRKCIRSWEKNMPDYEIVCWDMEKVTHLDNRYLSEAIACKKWAFASDYIRMYALYEYGGIYLDSDVYVRQSLEAISKHRVFSGIEYCVTSKTRTCNIEAAVIGAEPGHPFIHECLQYFDKRKFILGDNQYDQQIIPEIVADIAEQRYGFKRIPIQQNLSEGIVIYSPEIIAHAYLEHRSAKKCCAVHLCEGGWYKSQVSKIARVKSLLRRLYKSPLKTMYMLYWKFHFSNELNDLQ
ncbi:glycosyltransferase family 32 protein [Paramuribaculum intestinale]|uniref:glycosyltransferase family 32 protein n=1 Tax=Paramuribaculum intestinale TaxID=2094151 RepID=UPI0025B75463|nr:glycosyltransferase [Paramuribaculum intestinale]